MQQMVNGKWCSAEMVFTNHQGLEYPLQDIESIILKDTSWCVSFSGKHWLELQRFLGARALREPFSFRLGCQVAGRPRDDLKRDCLIGEDILKPAPTTRVVSVCGSCW